MSESTEIITDPQVLHIADADSWLDHERDVRCGYDLALHLQMRTYLRIQGFAYRKDACSEFDAVIKKSNPTWYSAPDFDESPAFTTVGRVRDHIADLLAFLVSARSTISYLGQIPARSIPVMHDEIFSHVCDQEDVVRALERIFPGYDHDPVTQQLRWEVFTWHAHVFELPLLNSEQVEAEINEGHEEPLRPFQIAEILQTEWRRYTSRGQSYWVPIR